MDKILIREKSSGYSTAEKAYGIGLVSCLGNNEFAPDKTVTATEFSTMVLRGANEGEFDWQQAINILTEKSIITEENSNTKDLFTCGDMAKIIYEAKANELL
ncbi:MAG: hypothetical protein Q8873_04105 [Bacillota bacterium]|nr:hypothetical protein [Bacillota bacterium]